ncbi:hypothetical protein [uncultured Nitratireductor sp.]|uniref:hypothetical protein n=1 Tax=uncultured Nitratireductor sp. TaxID=520953 RepID=UPI0025F2B36F|nr:hypothetical protein [uncultured Nitratireductor sp.]
MLQKYQINKHGGASESVPSAEAQLQPSRSGRAKDERLAVLEALLENPGFRASDRNRRFLRFVVEETIAGRADRIKAFTIAVDVFGRDANFDATVDPIVRIAAGQLRKSLRDYYAGPGQADPVQISIPLGAYVPTFERRTSTSTLLGFISRQMGKPRIWAAGAAVAAIAVFALSAATVPHWLERVGGAGHEGPAVLVLDSARTSQESAEATQLADMLNDALWLSVGREGAVRSVGVRPDEELQSVVSRIKTMYGTGSDVFELLTRVQVENGEARIYWHLLDSASREVRISSVTNEAFQPGAKGELVETIAAKVAASLFGYEGALARYQMNDAKVASHNTEK